MDNLETVGLIENVLYRTDIGHKIEMPLESFRHPFGVEIKMHHAGVIAYNIQGYDLST